jgi:eukaryotic-like serine/threonine-protein kinase
MYRCIARAQKSGEGGAFVGEKRQTELSSNGIMRSALSMTLQPFEVGGLIASKYRLRRKLAAGGAGEVWVARNEATRAKVALKVLRRGTSATLDAVERFRQEARIGGTLSHRNIVRVFDLIEQQDGTLVLVMELLAGETLASYLRRRAPLPAREAVGICVPILAALRHSHEQNVLHRDISPRNIFLVVEPDGHVVAKLVDFGLAKAPSWEFKTVEGSVLGTPSYMSPEQIRAESNVDARTDIYGVGAVLYEMLTGSPPYRGVTPMATLAAVLEAEGPDPRAIDEHLWPVVQSALSRNRDARPFDARAFAELLTSAVSGTGAELAEDLNCTSAVMVGSEIQDELSGVDDDAVAVSRATAPLGVPTAFGPGLPSAPPRPRGGLRLAAILGLVLVCAIVVASLTAIATRGTSASNVPLQVAVTAVSSLGARTPDEPPSRVPQAVMLPSALVPARSSMPSTHIPAPSTTAQVNKPRPIATTPGF